MSICYYIKKIGHSARRFDLHEIEKNDCKFWQDSCKIYFGKTPPPIRTGDILIQEVSCNDKKQNHAIVGIFGCLSAIMPCPDGGPHTCEQEKGKWPFYVICENLSLVYSQTAQKLLERNLAPMLNLDTLWKNLGNKGLPYNARGFAQIPEDMALSIIADIKNVQQKLKK